MAGLGDLPAHVGLEVSNPKNHVVVLRRVGSVVCAVAREDYVRRGGLRTRVRQVRQGRAMDVLSQHEGCLHCPLRTAPASILCRTLRAWNARVHSDRVSRAAWGLAPPWVTCVRPAVAWCVIGSLTRAWASLGSLTRE